MAGGEGFDRERFLLRTVVGVFVAQFGIYAVGLGTCFWPRGRQDSGPLCSSYAQNLQDSFDAAVGTGLALLGGGSIVAARRRDPDS